MATHAHSANHAPGSSGDKKARSDGNGPWSDGSMANIGSAFTPMIHTAGVARMIVKHDVISCPACSAGILWNRQPVSFLCQGCGATIDGKALTE